MPGGARRCLVAGGSLYDMAIYLSGCVTDWLVQHHIVPVWLLLLQSPSFVLLLISCKCFMCCSARCQIGRNISNFRQRFKREEQELSKFRTEFKFLAK